MPKAPMKPCTYPRCTTLVSKGSRCDKHARQDEERYEKERGTATERGYNHNWFKVRTMKLNRNPLCERCELDGRIQKADLVHHIDRNSRNSRADNLESLCRECHDEEHKGERWAKR